ncbi:MAG: TetR/AcrR family transcriptional regulator [Lachnospiraceae bacterium]
MSTEKRSQSHLIARECIVSALMQLLETMPLSAISVTELAKKAGVSRMTYYRNYSSKEEIFSTYLDDIFAAYKRDIASWPVKGMYNDYQHMLHCFQYFYTHKDFIKCLLKCGLGDLLLKSLSAYMIETYYTGEDNEASFCTEKDSKSSYYTLQAFAGALYNIYIAWIDRDTAESAEEMAAMMCSLFQ